MMRKLISKIMISVGRGLAPALHNTFHTFILYNNSIFSFVRLAWTDIPPMLTFRQITAILISKALKRKGAAWPLLVRKHQTAGKGENG